MNLTEWKQIMNLSGTVINIDDIPSEIDVAPVRHGYWKNYKDEHTCSCCDETVTGDWYDQDNDAYWYCPWCGAKMDTERKEE